MDEPGTPANPHDVGCPQFPDFEPGACAAPAEDLAECGSHARASSGTGACLSSEPLNERNRYAVPPPTPSAVPERPARRPLVPFVVQAGQRVFMLASESGAWVLAELKFDDERVAFLETRRARYEWPREAFGALLSRVALREVDHATVDAVEHDFSRWLGGQFIAE